MKRSAAAAILLLLTPSLQAAQGQAPAAPATAQEAAESFPKVRVTAGRSTVVPTDFDVTRIAVTNPAVADAVVVQPREILIDGKGPGTVSLIVWGPRRACSTTWSSNSRSRRSSSSCTCCSRART